MRLEPQAERLTITLSKAKYLPKNKAGIPPGISQTPLSFLSFFFCPSLLFSFPLYLFPPVPSLSKILLKTSSSSSFISPSSLSPPSLALHFLSIKTKIQTCCLFVSTDPHVKITVVQRTKLQTKESRVKKKTTSPAWKEAFSFLIKADLESLHYYTSVTITVYDHEVPGDKGIIGQVSKLT